MSWCRQYWHAHVVECILIEELTRVFPLAPTLAQDVLYVGVVALVVRV